MQILSRIDHLTKELSTLKSELNTDSPSNQKKFTELLESVIKMNQESSDDASETKPVLNAKNESGIPSWVDPDYSYDPLNPRKPNMRELMEAISGKSVEELYTETEETWQKISHQASEMLYGVIGSKIDTRDWNKIMSSSNILKSAQEETGAMHRPTVDIVSTFDETNKITQQIAVIKDKEGMIIRSLPENLSLTEETLHNFGATSSSIPENLEERTDPNLFSRNLLTFLKGFDSGPTSIENSIIQNVSDVIKNKVAHEIPLDELAKL